MKSFTDLFGKINPPDSIKDLTNNPNGGAGGLSIVLNNFISIIFTIAGIAVVFMVLFGAFQWITSGGEKEHVAKARSRITNAIIGLILLALAFFLLTTLGKILHFNFFGAQPSSAETCGSGTRELSDGHGCLDEISGEVVYCFSGYTASGDNTDCI